MVKLDTPSLDIKVQVTLILSLVLAGMSLNSGQRGPKSRLHVSLRQILDSAMSAKATACGLQHAKKDIRTFA